MRQVLRRYAFPYIVIAVLLAAALPFSCFATELVDVSNHIDEIWNAQNWNYYSYSNSSHKGTYETWYQFNDNSTENAYNGIQVVGRQLSKTFSSSRFVQVRFPVLLSDVESFSFDLYFGLYGINDGSYYRYSDSVSVYNFHVYSSSSGSETVPADILTSSASYIFRDSSSEPTYSTVGNYITLNKLHLSTSSENPTDIAYVWFSFEFSTLFDDPDIDFYFYVGMGSDVEIGTVDGGTNIILGGLTGIQGSIDGLVSEMQQSQGQILDELGNVKMFLESDAITTAEAEQLVSNSVSKGEQLKELGSALSNVNKPNVNNVTSVIKPQNTLSQASPQMVQNALSVVYSWDKLISILALVVALGTISYILFGKKR